jgi:hypothetical protein
MSAYIEFIEGAAKPKTRTWIVRKKDTPLVLGRISWMATWRRYWFEPGEATGFDASCLKAIAEFLEKQTRDHWDRLKGIPT